MELACLLKLTCVSMCHFSCIRGALIEVNERLVARPQLLQEKVRWMIRIS